MFQYRFQCIPEGNILLIQDLKEHISALDPIMQPQLTEATAVIRDPLYLSKFFRYQSQSFKENYKCSLAPIGRA